MKSNDIYHKLNINQNAYTNKNYDVIHDDILPAKTITRKLSWINVIFVNIKHLRGLRKDD